ncbi:hypothetical protein FRC00_001603 [Tulasnella sp. 408]|nr:hypothetical protein FRC00_001603 [Tulasnella sp. 408]
MFKRPVKTCKAFASLRDYLALPLQLLRLATEHDLSPDIPELPIDASAVRVMATRPQRFQDLLLQEGLNGQSLVCYHTTIQNEKILQSKIVPGGRWLVTITISIEDPSDQQMMCRVWDLDLAQEEIDLEPYASMWLPNTNRYNSGQLWLRRGTEGNTAQIWVYAGGLRVIEFNHLDRERPLNLLRIIKIRGMDVSEGIGLHGDYVFCVGERTIIVLNWVTGRRQKFGFDTSTLGAQDESEPAQASTNRLNLLQNIRQTPIQGVVPYGVAEPHHWPPVNRPYSARQPATAVIRFPQHLVCVEYPSSPGETDLDRLPLAFDLPSGSLGPIAFQKTMDGHVVGVGTRGFDVHFLLKNGNQSVQTFEHEFGDNFTRKFVCPLGGVIGSFGPSHRSDKIYLWKVCDGVKENRHGAPNLQARGIDKRLRASKLAKAFARIRNTYLKPALDVLRLVTLYDLGYELLDIPPIGGEACKRATIPYKFEEAIVSGLLSEDSLQRYETTVTGESVYSASLFPGGRWLVTASGNEDPDELEASLPFHLPSMKYRVWDLESVSEGLPPSPVACIEMPPDESEISGEVWLRKDEDVYRVWIYSESVFDEHCLKTHRAHGFSRFRHRLRELVFDPWDYCLHQRRSIDVSGLDTNYDIGFHGNYVFDYGAEFQILDRETSLRASFELSPEVMGGWLRWVSGPEGKRTLFSSLTRNPLSKPQFMTIGDDGMVILDSENRTLLRYRPNIPRWGVRDPEMDVADDSMDPRLELLQTVPITGMPPLKRDEILQTPNVNRPYSPGKSSTALVRFPGYLIYLEFSGDPSTISLERSFTAHPFPDRHEETTPRVHAKTISGHVVAIAKPFNVHLLRTGEDIITRRVRYDLEDADSTAAFVCPIGGVLGATHRMDEVWLWRADLA